MKLLYKNRYRGAKLNQKMGSKSSSNSKPKLFITLLIFFSFSFLILIILPLNPRKPTTFVNTTHMLVQKKLKTPIIFDSFEKQFKCKTKIKVGFVNIDDHKLEEAAFELFGLKEKQTEIVSVDFDHVNDDLKWDDFFPEWIDEDEKWAKPTCPEIPMPRAEDYGELDVIVAKVPCGRGAKNEGNRDVFRLQVNLVVANLVMGSGWPRPDVNWTVYVVFIGSCGPMVEIFRCDDMLLHQGDYWVYKPEITRLKQKVLMPVGSCQLASSYAQTGQEKWRYSMSQSTLRKQNYTTYHNREAYVTVLHSSEAYVCGAITLAQSILQTNSTRDLVLLADDSISSRSLRGLRAAGWKIRHIYRIRSPFAKKDAYNEWNYSKLRIWQLIEYDKIIFIDSDLIVLSNIDRLFIYPQLSAAPNDKFLFNSGIMVVEPSMCMFEDLMLKSFKLKSYNGGDQGFLNEVITWWHRLPTKLNHLKIYGDEKHEMPEEVYAIHYLGLKPWMCYRDYDCNWDKVDHHPFASDLAHEKWWKVYEEMPRKLQRYCGLTRKMDERIRKWRGIARNNKLADGHWKIEVKDPREHYYVA